MSLKLTDIRFTYTRGDEDAAPALDGVSTHVDAGGLLLVVGATGSGKSTLMRIMAGLMGPDGGEAQLDGKPLDSDSARGNVGLVFQDPESQLFADSVLADVAFGPRNLGLSKDLAEHSAREALDAVGLPADVYGTRSPFTLSGGEARRAAIAGVLAMRPSYLLFDEPMAGMDVAGRRAVRRVIDAERQRAGVVVVSHAAEEFWDIADRVLVLSRGRAVWSGSPEELLGNLPVFGEAALRLPALLEVQERAARAGCRVSSYSMDPTVAAGRLAEAGGWGL